MPPSPYQSPEKPKEPYQISIKRMLVATAIASIGLALLANAPVPYESRFVIDAGWRLICNAGAGFAFGAALGAVSNRLDRQLAWPGIGIMIGFLVGLVALLM